MCGRFPGGVGKAWGEWKIGAKRLVRFLSIPPYRCHGSCQVCGVLPFKNFFWSQTDHRVSKLSRFLFVL